MFSDKIFHKAFQGAGQKLVLPGEIEHQGPLPKVREEQQGQANEVMENPRQPTLP
jgi:hypothetical protein